MDSRQKKVFVGMSGGVDSSVAAALLKEEGYDVTGVHLRCFNVDGCAERDAEDARRAAEHLGIPFYVFDFEEEYKARVVEYMVDGYKKGITPNPDVMCNKEIKFGLFFDKARGMGADCIATGHYVRKAKLDGKWHLKIAKDTNKDQSYFLWTLTEDQIAKSLFPVGDYTKPEVRELAKKYNFHNAEKKDSQGICFLGQVTLEEFLKSYIPERRGEIVSSTGEKIGEHNGAHYYTIGQRHGLNLGMKNKELRIKGRHETKPHYVASKDVRTNTVVVAEGDDNPELFSDGVELTDMHFVGSVPREPINVQARIRYRQPLQGAELRMKNTESRSTLLIFDEPQKFVASGQSAVLYNENGVMIGGGIIR